MRSFLLALVLLASVPYCAAEVHDDAISVTFPDQVAGLSLSGREVFPQKGLGAAVLYRRAGPVIGTVYVYTSGLSGIPTGVDSPQVHKHFAQVLAEVKQLETLGRARSVKLPQTPEQVTRHPGCGPQFIWKVYEVELDQGKLTSYTYLTAMKNNFVKLRMSHRQDDPEGPRLVEQFVLEMRKILGAC